MDSESLSEFFSRSEFDDTNVSRNMAAAAAGGGVTSPDDIFSVLEAWEAVNNSSGDYWSQVTPLDTEPAAGLITAAGTGNRLVSQRSTSSSTTPTLDHYSENDQNETETSRLCKRPKVINNVSASITAGSDIELASPGQDGRMTHTHITVERNRRKQMNDHLTVLRSLMPCFYVKRCDQASIIGGVVNYIDELQQVLQSLEAKKQRKVYSEVLSPRIASSPRSSQISSPRKPPLSPRISVPISPRTPQPSSPYVGPPPRLHHQVAETGMPSPTCSSTSSINDSVNELVAHSKTAVAEVEVKFSGPNLLLKTMASRVPGQVVRIISALEDLSLEVLQLDITSVDETIIYSFTIKIGIECQLSAEELAQQIQQTFC